jgi:2'-5' RNA ligase
MGLEGNGAGCSAPDGSFLNVFALVIYIPDPLGKFLDDLRRELVPHYNPHAHVSVLPPRPLARPEDWKRACEQARAVTEAWAPFRVEATEVRVFPISDVIYLEIGAGQKELREMYAAMNASELNFREPYEYHPHITLAQEIPPGRVEEWREIASERWRSFRGDRSFMADRAVFVRNSVGKCWVDLAEFSLGAVAAR